MPSNNLQTARLKLIMKLLSVLLGAALALPPPAICAGISIFAVSLPQRISLAATDPWGEEEGVWGIKCSVKGGDIVAVSDIPYEWDVYVENGKDASKFDAALLMASFALANAGLDYFHHLFSLRRAQRRNPSAPLSINCDVDVSDIDEHQHRHIQFRQEQVIVEPVLQAPANPVPKQAWAVSLPVVSLANTERVVRFECTVTGARIASLKAIPQLWSLGAANGDPLKGKLIANSLVDSAALTRLRLALFGRFMSVQRLHSDAGQLYDMPLRIRFKFQIKTGPKRYRYARFNASQSSLESLH